MGDLKIKNEKKPSVRNAVFWNTASKFLQEGIRFVIAIILARLIDPSEFGIIAMVIVFISIGTRLTEGGFRSAIINKQDLNSTDCTTALLANLLLAVILATILWLTAPFIAGFYNETVLQSIIPILAIGLLFDAASIVQAALFTKQFRFKEQAIAGLVAAITTGVVGIGMALNGYGLWALVISGLVGKAFNSLMLWILSSWKPDALPSWLSFKKLFGYGSKIAVSGLIENITINLLPLMIGKFYGAASLGFYNRANSFKEIPTNNIYLITQPIIFSKLSSLQKNQIEFNNIYRRSTRLLAFMVIPTMILMIIVARLLVLALIGEKWLPSVIFLQILCVVGIFHQMMRINNDALISKGFAGVALKQEIIRKVMYVAAILITFNFSLTIMLYGIAIQTILSYIIMVLVADKVVNLNAVDQLKDALPYFFLSIVSGVPIIVMRMHIDLNVYSSLILYCLAFSSIYFALNRIFRLDGFNDFFSIIFRGKSKFFVKSKKE